MKFQTQIPLQPELHNQINYQSKLVLFGSCFVENIGEKLTYFKFQNLQNPFGILFHPLAIESLITNAINEKKYTDADVFYQNEQWHCFEAHSKLSNSSKEALLLALNTQLGLTKKHLEEATHVIITLGTAWVYRNLDLGTLVANCHKVPQKKFIKKLLTVDEVSESLQAIIALIKSVNKKVAIIFTVSPVRHIKDGFIENSQSKAHLVSAIHQVVAPRHLVYYFPSFEIMLDELRDYRFYSEDMLHPNAVAINYIWEKFKEVWIANESQKIMDDVDAIQKGMNHKPFNEASEAHKAFLKKLEVNKKQIIEQFPNIEF